MKVYNRLPLSGSNNTREHGGYATSDQGLTNWQQFLRSDDVSHLTAEDIKFIKDYGVKTVIDLRSDYERQQGPYALLAEPDIQCHHLPLGSGNGAQPVLPMSEAPDRQLGLFYIDCLEQSQTTIKEIMETLARSEGVTLFHCAAGKDRTGVISALLLNVAKVDQRDILAHYEITHGHISQKMVTIQGDFPIELSYSKPAYMELMLNHLITTYGNAETYLQQIGLSVADLHQLKAKLVNY